MASTKSTHRWITIAILAACSAFGAYATFGTAANNGLLDAIGKAVGPDVKPDAKHFPGGPKPYKITYTGIPAVDDHLLTLISFFVLLLDAPKTQDMVWVSRYMVTQFMAGWVLLSLEGLRKGNKGRVVSWTGTMGFIFQNITYTVTVPIYLIIHLLTSPVSNVNPSPAALAFDTQDLYLLPASVTMAYIVPTWNMSRPVSATLTAAAHYSWQALWQVFPVAQTMYHSTAKRLTAPLRFQPDFYPQLDDIYRAVALASFGPQTALLAVAATPAHLVPDALVKHVPGLTRDLFRQITLTNAFVPCLPWASPAVVTTTTTSVGGGVVAADGLPQLVQNFLQWDVYLGGAAVLAWAVFVHAAARPGTSVWGGTLPRAAVYTVLGGPVGAATMLLWDRDAAARKQSGPPRSVEGRMGAK